MSSEFKHLLSPIKIRNTTFKNRLCVAPMGDGYPNMSGVHGEYSDLGIETMVARARGGFGILFNGCSMFTDNKVDPMDPIHSYLYHKDYFLQKGLLMTERTSIYGAKIIQQLTFGVGRNHPGNYSCSPNTQFDDPSIIVPGLTKDQIKQKLDCVVEGAKIMEECGFAGVEVHALHWGYLLDQFAMSITNHREDEYGGVLENRLRLCKEAIDGIREVCGPNFIVTMRLGLKSYISGLNKSSLTGEDEAGRTLEEGICIARILESYGYDALSVDMGIYDSFYYAAPPIYIQQGSSIPLAAKCKNAVNIPVLCGGSRMNDPYMNEAAIADGLIDGVVLGRPSLADPDYGQKLEVGKPEKIRPCIGCLVGCMGNLRAGAKVSCAVNPTLRKELNYLPEKTLTPKSVAVVGGGIAGMEVARITKMRGHNVTIYEKSDSLGGLIIPASSHSYKQELRQLLDWYKGEVADMNIPVIYNTEMDIDKIKNLNVDAVVLSVGSKPLMPNIPGINHHKCMSGVDALNDEEKVGDRVVVVGGGLVGCEIAYDYAMQGKTVTIIEAAPKVLAATKMIPVMISQVIPDLLEHYQVDVRAGYKIESINDNGAVISPTAGGDLVDVPADTVIMSIGMQPIPSHASELYGSGLEVYTVGDCHEVGNLYTTIHSAYEVARYL